MAAAAGCTPFLVASGGTGVCAFQAGSIPFGNGTSPLATSTALQFSNSLSRLTVTNASTTMITATTASSTNLTISSTGTGASKCLRVDGLGNVSAAAADCATGGTPGGSSGDVQYNASGAFGGVATGTISGASVISLTAGRSAIGGALAITTAGGTFGAGNYVFPTDLTITGDATTTHLAVTSTASTSALVISSTGGAGTRCLQAAANGTVSAASAGCGTGSGSVTSITNGGGLDNFTTITTTGTITAQIGTSSVPTVGQFPQWTGNGTPSTLGSVASSTFFTGTTGQNGYFAGTGLLIGTSSLFTTTLSQILIGTTTAVATNNTLLQVGSGKGQSGIEINGGNTNASDGAALIIGSGATAASNTVLGGVGSPSAYFGSTLDLNMGVFANSALELYTNNTNLIRGKLQTTGEFGIGTTSPFARFSVHQFANDLSDKYLFAIASSTSAATTTVFSTTAGGQTASCETVYGSTAGGAFYASSTAMIIDFQQTCNQVLLQVGGAAFTVTARNAKVGDTKRIIIANPSAAAGAVTWSGFYWLGGTTPSQTTTANGGDVYSCLATQATSTVSTSVKVECNQGAGIQ